MSHVSPKDIQSLDQIPDDASATLRVVPGETGSAITVDVPPEVLPLIVEILQRAAQGQSSEVVTQGQELTTQEAARLLSVSRPYLVRLLEEGHIPFRKVGRYRRVALSDLLAYKAADDAKRGDAMQELADIAQQWGMGY